MLKQTLFGLLLLFLNILAAQKPYFQQHVDYNISATLNDTLHILRGSETVSYQNNAPQELPFLYFHLWMNAFKSKKSAYTVQALKQGNSRFYFAEQSDMGGYTDLDIAINGQKCAVEADAQYDDIIKIILPNPLKTGEKVNISINFAIKIPYAFSRGGHIKQQYLMTQWYPKPAVLDAEGWHQMPYLDQGEFYAEFGNYDVTLTLPKKYVVGATGVLQTASERDFLEKKCKNTEGVSLIVGDTIGYKTIQYAAKNVHDFAWFADKNFEVRKSQVTLRNNKNIETYAFFTPKHAKLWGKATDYINQAVAFYSEQVGTYPHPQATAVMTEATFEGGMEYPMITALSGQYDAKSLDGTIAHEVGHNWFQGILASNERDYPWLDEGLNSYYEKRYLATFYPKDTEGWFMRSSGYGNTELFLINKMAKREDQPATLHSDSMTQMNYYAGAYEKPVMFLNALEKKVGRAVLDSLMRDYYKKWQFKHPQPNDFFAVLSPHIAQFDTDLPILTETKPLQSNLPFFKRPIKLKLAVGVDNINQRNIYWSPALAANIYDQSMIGLLLHNGFIPYKSLEWAVAPMYGVKSKKLTGIADINYGIFTPNNHKITFNTNVRRFSYNKTPKNNYLAYTRITPAVALDFWKKPLSQFVHSLKLRHTFLNEEQAFKDSLERISIRSKWSNMTEFSYAGQLRRTLTPMSFRVAVEKFSYSLFEKRQSFIKTTFELNQDFMYREGRKIFTRFFIGGFPVNSGRNTGLGFTRGFLGLSARGFSDYRYDDFYFGRNEFSGITAQQITQNMAHPDGGGTEGGLKFTLPEGEQTRIGYSNNFIASMNFRAHLPFKLPIDIKPYFDFGFFSDTRPGGERTKSQWLASGGFAWDFEDYFGIYFPIYYSGSSTDPNSFHSIMTRRGNYLSRITFSINLKKMDLRKLIQSMY
jgi:hypothetical protein